MKRPVRDFLYVPRDEIDEAYSLGAVSVLGDARLAIPRPLPIGIEEKSFKRWQSVAARYRWCAEFMTAMLGDMLRGKPGLDDLLAAMRGGRADGEARIYLYVTQEQAPKLRETPGIKWDRRRRLFYATRDANLNALFDFMTPAAKASWEAERATIRALDLLVRDRARAEKARRDAGDGGLEGQPQERRDQALDQH